MTSATQTMPTVVLLGDVGMGKSTVVEKITGVTGISSDADESCLHHQRQPDSIQHFLLVVN